MAYKMNLEEWTGFAQEEMNRCVWMGGLYFMWYSKWTKDKYMEVLRNGKENRKKSISYLEAASFQVHSGEKNLISHFDDEKLI